MKDGAVTLIKGNTNLLIQLLIHLFVLLFIYKKTKTVYITCLRRSFSDHSINTGRSPAAIDRWPESSKPAARRCRSTAQTDRQTDTIPLHRRLLLEAASVSNLVLKQYNKQTTSHRSSVTRGQRLCRRDADHAGLANAAV